MRLVGPLKVQRNCRLKPGRPVWLSCSSGQPFATKSNSFLAPRSSRQQFPSSGFQDRC